ncbi:universal stress protein [Bacillus sp. FJAT-42315]|uniref:universal stress protein n=1 Tax=Bacillus sp. FJAT-42315 TaxID=2014077 RepID=UPI0012FEEC09|nr:universal stress protein [Bacillus sp. FJAT-42315]
MAKTIIVPVDGSDAALKVIPYATELAQAYGDDLLLLNIQATLKELGMPAITKASSMIDHSEYTVATKIRVGIPAIEIVTEAHDPNVRCVVMAIGKGHQEEIGSVSKQVLELATCPVMLVPEHAENRK